MPTLALVPTLLALATLAPIIAAHGQIPRKIADFLAKEPVSPVSVGLCPFPRAPLLHGPEIRLGTDDVECAHSYRAFDVYHQHAKYADRGIDTPRRRWWDAPRDWLLCLEGPHCFPWATPKDALQSSAYHQGLSRAPFAIALLRRDNEGLILRVPERFRPPKPGGNGSTVADGFVIEDFADFFGLNGHSLDVASTDALGVPDLVVLRRSRKRRTGGAALRRREVRGAWWSAEETASERDDAVCLRQNLLPPVPQHGAAAPSAASATATEAGPLGRATGTSPPTREAGSAYVGSAGPGHGLFVSDGSPAGPRLCVRASVAIPEDVKGLHDTMSLEESPKVLEAAAQLCLHASAALGLSNEASTEAKDELEGNGSSGEARAVDAQAQIPNSESNTEPTDHATLLRRVASTRSGYAPLRGEAGLCQSTLGMPLLQAVSEHCHLEGVLDPEADSTQHPRLVDEPPRRVLEYWPAHDRWSHRRGRPKQDRAALLASLGRGVCWSGGDEDGRFAYARCCDLARGPRGDPTCWDDGWGYTPEFCCDPGGLFGRAPVEAPRKDEPPTLGSAPNSKSPIPPAPSPRSAEERARAAHRRPTGEARGAPSAFFSLLLSPLVRAFARLLTRRSRAAPLFEDEERKSTAPSALERTFLDKGTPGHSAALCLPSCV
jgi:hypothetical protein